MITTEDLLHWLKNIDSRLHKEMTIIAVGGTAMTLLNLKESTRDVDFCIESKNAAEFKEVAKSNLFVVDIFQNGYIFALQLPDDYAEKAILFREFKHLKIRILILEDIILTKTSRLNSRDLEDIKALAATGRIDFNFLKKRFEEIVSTFAGSEEEFRYHFDLVLKMFFASTISKNK